jgi:hypothetical protein
MKERLRREPARDFRIRFRARLQIKLGVTLGTLADRALVGQDRLGDSLRSQALRRGCDPLVADLGKHDPQATPADCIQTAFQCLHHLSLQSSHPRLASLP